MPLSIVERKINLKRIAHVYYTHADLEKAHEFLLDFGFSVTQQSVDEVYYRGYGAEPFVYCARRGAEDAFGGAAFVVDSMEDLELAAKKIPGASEIYESKAPGGGKCVTFHDPIAGRKWPWHLVYGQTLADMTETFPELNYNFPTSKHRSVGKTQRFKRGPAPVHKLGHYGCCVTDFAKTFEFYTTKFNFKPSDIVFDKDKDVTAFYHLDRGDEMVDHHCFFFLPS